MAVEALATKDLIHGREKHGIVHGDIQLNVSRVARAKRIAEVASLAETGRLVKRAHVLVIKTTVRNETITMRTRRYNIISVQ